MVASAHLHFGEEAPLVGNRGSGTLFFAGCNLACVFCQNAEISQAGGTEVSAQQLAELMLKLQARGAHNINLVSPSHVVPQILEALVRAADAGLRVPLVFNTGGYDSISTLRLLDGVVDIYMPDAKYADPHVGLALSGVEQYPSVNRLAIKEMHRQVGDLVEVDGMATSGLVVRHLVLPSGLAGTESVMEFLASEVSVRTYVNVMDQYRPQHRAGRDARLCRGITQQEHEVALRAARGAGLTRLAEERWIAGIDR